MIPPLCLQRHTASAFSHHQPLFAILHCVADEMNVGMILDPFIVGWRYREEQFVIFTTIERAGYRIDFEFDRGIKCLGIDRDFVFKDFYTYR